MAGKCEHGLTTRECMVCASPKYGAETGDRWVTIPRARLAELEAMGAMDTEVMKMQRDSLRDALRKVLAAGDREAKARMIWQNASENFSDSVDERKAHERAMLAANNAEREARVLLLTLRDGA